VVREINSSDHVSEDRAACDELESQPEHNFDELVRSTYKSSLALAVRLVGNLEDASDVIQDAYLKAYRAIGSFRGEASFETWFHRIVSNTAFSFRHRRGRRSARESASMVEAAHEWTGVLESDTVSVVSSAKIDLERALAKLPSRLTSVIILKDLYGLSHREIAEKLQITEATAKVWLHRGRKRLGELVGDHERGQEDDPDHRSAA
jgi:RNA polymerase sigma-70 factor (ECF subfamily)